VETNAGLACASVIDEHLAAGTHGLQIATFAWKRPGGIKQFQGRYVEPILISSSSLFNRKTVVGNLYAGTARTGTSWEVYESGKIPADRAIGCMNSVEKTIE